jgi:predicted transcriptional regulator of viral defense system
LKPSAYQIAKDYIERDGKLIGYITGYSAYNALGLTTQISSYIQIGTNKSRRAVKRDKYTISFIMQQNTITKKNIEILRILDAVRFIREIPATTPNEACIRLKEIIKDLNDEQKEMLVKCSLKYTNYVRALCGAILEDIGYDGNSLDSIRKSLNGVTNYHLPISESVLPNKQNWRIYEPARK